MEDENDYVLLEPECIITDSNSYIQNAEIAISHLQHSVFSVEEYRKPKEVFTLCSHCGQYVVVSMTEDGSYSKCKHCFNCALGTNFLTKRKDELEFIQTLNNAFYDTAPSRLSPSVPNDLHKVPPIKTNGSARNSRKIEPVSDAVEEGKENTEEIDRKGKKRRAKDKRLTAPAEAPDVDTLKEAKAEEVVKAGKRGRKKLENKVKRPLRTKSEKIKKKKITLEEKPARVRYRRQCDGETEFKCSVCTKSFTRNWYLKQHLRIHSNERPFHCPECGKRFLNTSNLRQHLKKHSIFKCDWCRQVFDSKEMLAMHRNGNVVPRKCYYCDERYTSCNEMARHINILHMERRKHGQYSCKESYGILRSEYIFMNDQRYKTEENRCTCNEQYDGIPCKLHQIDIK